MRAKGWLETVTGEDARTQSFQLTPQGRKLLERAYPLWQEAQRRAAEILGKDAIAYLNKTASKLRSAVEGV